MHETIYLHAHNVWLYKQKQVLNCQLTLHWQAIYCTWGLRMSSSTWHKSAIHHVCVAELLIDTVGLLCNKRLALNTHTRNTYISTKILQKTLKTYFAQISSLLLTFYSPPTSQDMILEFQVITLSITLHIQS